MPMLMMLSREVRRVPMGWEPPRDARGRFLPMHDQTHADALAEYEAERAKWERGEFPAYATAESRTLPYEEWNGHPPDEESFRPEWPADAEMGIRMYETVTEGTPISATYADTDEGRRAMADELAQSEHGITTGMAAEDWLRVIGGEVLAKDIHTGEVS
jgi:hypothetical protein